jgi:hypothetical protein
MPQLRSHFADGFRTSVFSGYEDALLCLAAHLLACSDCQTREVLFVERLTSTRLSLADIETTACVHTRSSFLRFLEHDRALTVAVLQHLLTCDARRTQLTDAARNTLTVEVHGD